MFKIIQSNDTDTLITHLLQAYTTRTNQVFRPFTVIVPSMVLGDWLTNVVAERTGISTLFTAEFWGQYQWELLGDVLSIDAHYHKADALKVPEVAVLSASIMRWRMYGYFRKSFDELAQNAKTNPNIKSDNDKKITPLHDEFYSDEVLAFLLKPLIDSTTFQLPEHRLWQLCQELASLYVRYLTHRPEWLDQWAQGKSLKDVVEAMIADKDKLRQDFIIIPTKHHDDADSEVYAQKTQDDTAYNENDENPNKTPDWLRKHYIDVEHALGTIWQTLFGQTHLYRRALERRFWQVLEGNRGQRVCDAVTLPTLYIFTVQQIPQIELDFLRRYALYADVILYHFNPSMMFWADIVDQRWLERQAIIDERSVYLKDYGHGLLSRLGKESRETFVMLAELSGGADDPERLIWQNDFKVQPTTDILSALKHDILMLTDAGQDADGQGVSQVSNHLKYDLSGMLRWGQAQVPVSEKTRPCTTLTLPNITSNDMMTPLSLSIHACHNLRRQLEIARLMIASYLNEDSSRHLSDVVVLLPDVVAAEEMIYSVFPDGKGADGLRLPIKITGTPDKRIDELLVAITGFYTLLGEPTSRFYANDVYEWLMNPTLYDSFNLDFNQMQRACMLLTEAGFRRGFDEEHLAHTLADGDYDYRYSFSYALDRIVLGLLMAHDNPTAVLYPNNWISDVPAEKTIPLSSVSLGDKPIVDMLCQIHAALNRNRHQYQRTDTANIHLKNIEKDIINRYFTKYHDSIAMRAIFTTINTMMANLRANAHYHRFTNTADEYGDEIYLSLKFVLQSLSDATKGQAISAEPSQVITFARFGTLRTITFGLTVMIDMNLSAFPRTDGIGRLDLMRAGLKRRGDRYNEDDDNGAFLDALLCTRERVLIFYQGIASDGKTRLLPATPVGELMEFFKNEIQWQIHDSMTDEADGDAATLSQILPSLIESYLLTHHAPTAFDNSIFYEQPSDDENKDTHPLQHALQQLIKNSKAVFRRQLPPPPIWQSVRATLDSLDTAPPVPTIRLMGEDKIADVARLLNMNLHIADEIVAGRASPDALGRHVMDGCERLGVDLPRQMSGDKLIACFKNPAISYLQGKIRLVDTDDDVNPDEPLMLDGLSGYQLNDALLKLIATGMLDNVEDDKTQMHQALSALYYGDLLPAGVPRWHTPTDALRTLTDTLDDYRQAIRADEVPYSALISATEQTSVTLQLGVHNTTISAVLPTSDVSVWQRVVPQSARAVHLFGFWVHHLLWQIARADGYQSVQDDMGLSLWWFNKAGECYDKTHLFGLPTIHPVKATAYLYNLLIIQALMMVEPVVMTSSLGLLQALYEAKQDVDIDVLAPKTQERWLIPPYNANPQSDCYLHYSWQTLLDKIEPISALATYLPIIRSIYIPMAMQIQPYQ